MCACCAGLDTVDNGRPQLLRGVFFFSMEGVVFCYSAVLASSLASGTPCRRDEMGPRIGPTLPRKQCVYCAAPAHVHSAHAAFQLLKNHMHSHNPPSPWAGLTRVFACILLHLYRGVILDLTCARIVVTFSNYSLLMLGLKGLVRAQQRQRIIFSNLENKIE